MLTLVKKTSEFHAVEHQRQESELILIATSGTYPHREFVLPDEDVLEGRDAVLLIEQKRGLLAVQRVHGSERDGAVAVVHQHGIADDAGRPCYSRLMENRNTAHL